MGGLCDGHDAHRRAGGRRSAAIYAQVTVNDIVIARYTADAWRGRVYAVRYFLTFLVSGAAVSTIAFLHGRGGFDLVLAVTAVIALGFVVATAVIAVLVNGVEKERTRVVAAGGVSTFFSVGFLRNLAAFIRWFERRCCS